MNGCLSFNTSLSLSLSAMVTLVLVYLNVWVLRRTCHIIEFYQFKKKGEMIYMKFRVEIASGKNQIASLWTYAFRSRFNFFSLAILKHNFIQIIRLFFIMPFAGHCYYTDFCQLLNHICLYFVRERTKEHLVIRNQWYYM